MVLDLSRSHRTLVLGLDPSRSHGTPVLVPVLHEDAALWRDPPPLDGGPVGALRIQLRPGGDNCENLCWTVDGR